MEPSWTLADALPEDVAPRFAEAIDALTERGFRPLGAVQTKLAVGPLMEVASGPVADRLRALKAGRAWDLFLVGEDGTTVAQCEADGQLLVSLVTLLEDGTLVTTRHAPGAQAALEKARALGADIPTASDSSVTTTHEGGLDERLDRHARSVDREMARRRSVLTPIDGADDVLLLLRVAHRNEMVMAAQVADGAAASLRAHAWTSHGLVTMAVLTGGLATWTTLATPSVSMPQLVASFFPPLFMLAAALFLRFLPSTMHLAVPGGRDPLDVAALRRLPEPSPGPHDTVGPWLP